MDLIKKYKETILYLIFGVLSTIINIITYVFFTKILVLNYLVANAIAWILAVIFAYITNKFWVFESKEINSKYILKEFFSFFGCRVFSGAIEMFMMFILVSIMSFNDFIVKIITNVVVVVLNYIFSKLLIFKKK